MASISPETCPFEDMMCTECPSRMNCLPLDPMLALQTVQVDKPKHRRMPAWLKDASASVKRSYGF